MAVPSGFAQSTWSSGLTEPTAMAFAPDGRLFVSEQGGALRVVSAGGQLLAAPFVTVPARHVDEQGLLSVAFDPGYASNRHVYAHWITADRTNRVSRDDERQNESRRPHGPILAPPRVPLQPRSHASAGRLRR